MARKKSAGVPVTRRALIQRINRSLGKSQGHSLKKARGRATSYVGDYYILDLASNAVVRERVDLEALAAKLGVLRGYERVVDD